MRGPADETVGEFFSVPLLEKARDKTLAVIMEAAARIGPGSTEKDAKDLISEIQSRLGGPKSWHPPQIRFGCNSVLPFGAQGQAGVRLQENDIYFLDIGPIFDGHEGDVGRSFALGHDHEMQRCCRDVEIIWNETRDFWKAEKATGGRLYDFARAAAGKRGWELLLNQANGHRIADFPHAARARGSIEEFPACPVPDRWILEIQIRHPSRPFGTFFEDLLR
jgi:methionyl aminopeptidase